MVVPDDPTSVKRFNCISDCNTVRSTAPSQDVTIVTKEMEKVKFIIDLNKVNWHPLQDGFLLMSFFNIYWEKIRKKCLTLRLEYYLM